MGTGISLKTKERVTGNKESLTLSTSSTASTKDATSFWRVEPVEDDLIDEDALLKEDDINDDNNIKGCGDDASGKPKRACANCSCGLAEKQAAEENGNTIEENKNLSVEDKLAKTGGCGGCAKGDAFRCAGCPFLGKPAFEPGQEALVLSMSDDI